MMKITEKNIKNFWKKVEKTDDCWFWRGAISNTGYGNFCFRKKNKLIQNGAHRFSYILQYGKIPRRKFVCHKCDNPSCVNPLHLFVGTNSENIKDSFNKGRIPIRGEKHYRAKLTDESVRHIRNLYATKKYIQLQLAEKFGVTRRHISFIVNKQKWAHI